MITPKDLQALADSHSPKTAWIETAARSLRLAAERIDRLERELSVTKSRLDIYRSRSMNEPEALL